MITHTLTDTVLILPMGGVIIPVTVSLKSSDPTRKIEYSVDGGEEYFVDQPDLISATMLVTDISARITHLKITGAVGNIVKLVS
jgi:hypothetical protein